MALSDADLIAASQPQAAGGLSDEQLHAAAPPRAAPTVYDPTEGMSWWEKGLAGMGKGFVDLGQGVRHRAAQVADFVAPRDQNLSSLVAGQPVKTRAQEVEDEINESRRRDAPLMNTGWGTAGYVAGQAAAMAPLAPLATGVGSAAALGGAAGYLQPSTSVGETLANTGLGVAGGAGGALIGKGVQRLGAPAARAAAPTAADIAEAAIPGEAAAPSAARAAAQGVATDAATGAAQQGAQSIPGKLTTGQQKLLKWGDSKGFQATPAQRSGNVQQAQIEAALQAHPASSKPFSDMAAANQTRLNEEVARALGAVDANGTPVQALDNDVLGAVHDKLGRIYEAARNVPKGALDQDAGLARLAEIDAEAPSHIDITQHPVVSRFWDALSKGEADGADLRAWSVKLGKDVRSQMTSANGDRDLGVALGGVKSVIDDSLADIAAQHGQDGLAGALRQANGQYRTLMNLTGRGGPIDSASGNVSGLKLANTLASKDRNGYTFGGNQSDLYNAARYYKAFASKIGDSGTATRMGYSVFDPRGWAERIGGSTASSLYFNPVARAAATAASVPAQKVASVLTGQALPESMARRVIVGQTGAGGGGAIAGAASRLANPLRAAGETGTPAE